MNKRILVVDDEIDLRELLHDQLAMHAEFSVTSLGTAREAMALLKQERFDLVILDVGLPDIDGREACRLMRKQGLSSPVIMLTAHDSDADTILGLEAGANDYVTKPFRFPVLLARIRVQLRQHELSEDATLIIGPYQFSPARRSLTHMDGSRVNLTDKETGILKYLHRANGRPVVRRELLEKVWGYRSGVNTHTLETHIYRLRQKLEEDTSAPQLIVREGGGYRLVTGPEVTRIDGAGIEAVTLASTA
jgi:DNA-binding response OmpR family regulator